MLNRNGIIFDAEAHNVFDEFPEIPSKGSATFVYSIRDEWYINQYELKVSYRIGTTTDQVTGFCTSSPPISFDIQEPDLTWGQ